MPGPGAVCSGKLFDLGGGWGDRVPCHQQTLLTAFIFCATQWLETMVMLPWVLSAEMFQATNSALGLCYLSVIAPPYFHVLASSFPLTISSYTRKISFPLIMSVLNPLPNSEFKFLGKESLHKTFPIFLSPSIF